MMYATGSKAFRAGAYSYTIPSWTATNNATSENLTAGLAESPPFVAPESVENSELGMRSEWFDRRLRINLTYYDMDYANRQAAVPMNVPITQAAAGFIIVTTNTGDVALDGIELDGQIAATDNLTFDFSAGTVNYTLANVCANNGDFLFPGPADDSYAVGATWAKPLSAGSDLTFSLNYGWTGKQQTHPGGVADPVGNGCAPITTAFYDSRYELPDYGLWNGRVRYTSQDGNWSLTFFGNNLTDEVYANYASRFGGGFWDAGGLPVGLSAPQRSALSLTRGRPREYGVTFQYNFGGGAAAR
jgi:iron complex outermembrane receptor protein